MVAPPRWLGSMQLRVGCKGRSGRALEAKIPRHGRAATDRWRPLLEPVLLRAMDDPAHRDAHVAGPARVACAGRLELTALRGLPIVEEGDNLPQLIVAALTRGGITLRGGDVLVVTSKIVSRSEGRFVD